MAYTTIDNPELFFITNLHTGNGSTQNITGLDFAPDWVWFKNRDENYDHYLFDSVRGATKHLETNNTSSETTNDDSLTSFNSDGWTTGDDLGTNKNTHSIVTWNWKAGTSFSNDASATGIGTIDSSGSVNTDAGISIMSYTGNGSNSASFAHGLGVKPQIVLIKNRSTAKNWVYWQDTTGNGTSDIRLVLNLTNSNYNNYHVTFGTTTITLGNTDDAWNKSGDNLIAYCFAEKKGYSKFGNYIGNGNANGTFVYTGFSPSMVIFKNTAASQDWVIKDNKRPGFNQVNDVLYPNGSYAEGHGADIDFLSNGFKCRTTADNTNKSGSAFIYMAFAESSFVNSSGVPTNAR